MSQVNELKRQQIPQVPAGPTSKLKAIVNGNVTEDVPNLVSQWQCERVVIVASRSMSEKSRVLQDLKKSLGTKVVGEKIGVGSHTPYPDVLEITKILQMEKADCLVSIGSSSYSDACKIARLLAPTLRPQQLTADAITSLMDLKKGRTKPGVLREPTAKLILVPCTLSASEYNPISSATDPRGKKEHFGESIEHVAAAADVILLDPAIIDTVPQNVWLESGARAIDHCVEAMVSTRVGDEGTKVAQDSLADLIRGLSRYKAAREQNPLPDGTQMLDAVSSCQVGARGAISTLICYQSKMGPSHAIGHQMGSVGQVPHGLTSCIGLPATLRYEKKHPESKHWDVQKQQRVLDVYNKELGWNESDAGTAVENFYRQLGLPTKLSEVGVTDEKAIHQIAQQTLTDIWGNGEPQLTEVEEVLEVLSTAR